MNKLIQELKQTIVEFDFTHRWSEIEKWHAVGKLLNTNIKPSQLLEIANLLQLDEEVLWYAVLFYKMFPDLNMLPEGKNVNWEMIREKYLE